MSIRKARELHHQAATTTAHNFVLTWALLLFPLNTYPVATGCAPMLAGMANGVLRQLCMKKTGCMVAGSKTGIIAAGIGIARPVWCGGIASIWVRGVEMDGGETWCAAVRVCCWKSGVCG